MNTNIVGGTGAGFPDPDEASIELLAPEDVLGIGTGSDILVVDDNDTNLVAYEAALAPLGRKLVLARSGTEALRQLLDRDFALVLLDFSMPVINGLETARMVRARPRSKGTPILFISGESPSSEIVIEAFDVGAMDFISKPIVPEVLRAKVSVYLRLQERTAQLLRQTAILAAHKLEAVERERQAAAAELANARKDEFLAMLGHELRNPLAAITSAVELIGLRGAGVERATTILQRQLSQITHIVDDLLDVSRITRGLITLRREAVQLRDAVTEAIEMVEPSARLAHALTVDVPTNAVVDADRNRLIQVIFNLVSNAVKYTPAPGRIDVTAEQTGDFVTIVVRDNGRGIPPALLPDIFELFVQGERGLDRREGGLGIGLTLVRTLVQLHGGTIEATSAGAGQGTTFTLRWPRASRKTATREMPRLHAPRAETPDESLRVLIVDDNVDAAEMLATLVESMGHIVEVANSGEAAIVLAKEFAPQIVLLDLALPGIDGYEVSARLHALPGRVAPVVIAVSGYGAPEDLTQSRQSGIAQHIMKPVDPATLRALFENTCK